jgi:hypothetical protein
MFCLSPHKEQIIASGSSVDAAPEGGFPTSVQLKWIILILMAYFGLRLLFLATSISPVVPPDEETSFGICTIFSTFTFLPINTQESYQYGLVTNIPWLYYWIMGKLLALNFLGISDLVFLRILNIPLAFTLVFYTWRTLRLITDDRLTQILLLVAMTNTMMLTFLSAFVSYDNLTNLLAAMSVYYLLAFFKHRSAHLLAASLVCQLAGCLTKLTFLPLVPIFSILLIIYEIKKIPRLPSALVIFYRDSKRNSIIVTVALLLGLGLNIHLYVGNFINFGKITPATTDVLPLENALQHRLTARGYIFNLFKEGRVSKEKALEMTKQIKHSGDRADAAFMIEKYARIRENNLQPMSLPEYIPMWVERMAGSIFGVIGHLAIPNYWPMVAPIALLAALTFLAMLIRWRPWDEQWIPTCLMAIAGFYTCFLLYNINYDNYLNTGARYVALQGRYIFPVIGSIYILSSRYLMQLFQGRAARLAVFGLAAFIFIMSDFPLFLARITPDWFNWTTN